MMFIYVIVTLLICSYQCHPGKRKKVDKNAEATIIFAGDISFDGPVKYFADVAKTCDYMRPFDEIRSKLMDADLRVANLESPLMDVSSRKVKLSPSKAIHHRGKDKAAIGLKYVGLDVIQLANNHMADFGSDGIKSTMKLLKKHGISYIGVSDNSKRRGEQRPLIKYINGVKIGMLAYCWNYEGCGAPKCDDADPLCGSNDDLVKVGPASFSKRVALKEVANLKRKVDIVIVLLHWGKELTPLPALSTRVAARDLKLAGANVIIGTHPHVIQGHECISDSTLVVYSLGNFLMAKAGSITKQFLAGRTVSQKDVDEYLNKTENVFSLSQQAYLVKVKVDRHSIISAKYLPIEIRSEKETHCLQPVPRGTWLDICKSDDIYCYDFRNFYANSSMAHEEQLQIFDQKFDNCIKRRKN